jgi:hypothetical protein
MRRSTRAKAAPVPEPAPESVPRPEVRRESAVAAPRAVRDAPVRRAASAPRQPIPDARGKRDEPASAQPALDAAPRRESLLSARDTEERPKRARSPPSSRSRSPQSRSPPSPTDRKRTRTDRGALTRATSGRCCWRDLVPDELFAAKILATFDTRHLLYLRLVSRKFRASMQFVPAVQLNPMRRRLPAERARLLLAIFPTAQQLALSGCLAPAPEMLDLITCSRAPRPHSHPSPARARRPHSHPSPAPSQHR